MRTVDEIRQYFINMLRNALTRLSMYGGETAARQILWHLAFIDDREQEVKAHFDELTKRSAFLATGVSGAFRACTSLEPGGPEIGSVYAEIAFQMDYLRADRILSRQEFESLRSGIRKICRARDFTTNEVNEEFGTPSWTSGSNPFYPWVFLYVTDQPTFATIAFDFWNVPYHDAKLDKVCGKYGDLPVLRNVRIRGRKFAREFTFTPIGRTLCKRG